MKIRNCRLVTSSPTLELAPPPAGPDFAIIGRSNVGKSSLINILLNRKIAHTSNTPGKTRLMNFYLVNEVPPGGKPWRDGPTLTLVDLPGYGFAKVARTEREMWDRRMRDFMLERESLALVLHLIDARHGPQPNDEDMNDWLLGNDVRRQVVLTKTDKISKAAVAKVLDQTRIMLKLSDSHPPLPFSAEAREGTEQLWKVLLEALSIPR